MFSKLFDGQSSQKLYTEGIELYHRGKAEEAVNKFSEAIKMETAKVEPDNRLLSNMHCMRGEVYLMVGVALLSQSDFTYALQYNSDNEGALNNLGLWYSIPSFNPPDYARSFECFDKAIALQPGRKDIQLNKACIKIQSGDKSGCEDLRNLADGGYSEANEGIKRYCHQLL